MDIRITLDNARAYSGGMIFGKVRLDGELEPVTAIRCVLGYDATRHGTKIVVEGLLAEQLPAGRTQLELPLELKVPDDAPVSYRGEQVSIDWFLEVSADLPWTANPKRRVPVKIAPRPEEIPPAEIQPLKLAGPSAVGVIGAIVVAVLVLALPAVLVAVAGLIAVFGPRLLPAVAALLEFQLQHDADE